MWQSVSVGLLILLAGLAQAASEVGHLFIYDSSAYQPKPVQTVSPETARLILASQLGVESYHEVGSGKSQFYKVINDYSSGQKLFGSSSGKPPVALILAQDYKNQDVYAVSQISNGNEIVVSQVPKQSDTRELLSSLAVQTLAEAVGYKLDISDLIDTTERLESGRPAVIGRALFQTADAKEDLKSNAVSLIDQGYTVLVLMIPAVQSSKASYGRSILPVSQNYAKRQNREEPLEPDVSSPSSGASSTPLAGILPQCFSSMSACQSVTRNCTGHGSCSLKYTDKDASDTGAPCYSCQCTSEVRTNADGTNKTTNWGGPACQKKDVVAPFWLLAGFTVFLVFIVTWGIGLLYTMGSEELPSVIGAGVSGVPKK